MPVDKAAQVAQAVEVKLVEVEKIPHGGGSGRRLELGGKVKDGQYLPSDPAFVREATGKCMAEIATRVGLDFFQEADAVRLEQFSIMSICQNHDTGGLLRSLINSFFDAYNHPETNARAYQCLLTLEALRREVEVDQKAVATARALKDLLDLAVVEATQEAGGSGSIH